MMQTVRATVYLASPTMGDEAIPAESFAIVDETNADIQGLIAAGFLVPDSSEPPSDTFAATEPNARMSREDLVAIAEQRGLAVPDAATKKDLVAMLEAEDVVPAERTV